MCECKLSEFKCALVVTQSVQIFFKLITKISIQVFCFRITWLIPVGIFSLVLAASVLLRNRLFSMQALVLKEVAVSVRASILDRLLALVATLA